jgi:hypothetical protein
MTYGSDLFMPDDRQVLTRRLSAYVRPVPAKVLAQKIGCTERVAENIRKGHWPIARHWAALVRAFGRDLTDCVFHPDAAYARLTEEVAELEAKLAERRTALRVVEQEARSVAPRHPQAGARAQDRSAGLTDA